MPLPALPPYPLTPVSLWTFAPRLRASASRLGFALCCLLSTSVAHAQTDRVTPIDRVSPERTIDLFSDTRLSRPSLTSRAADQLGRVQRNPAVTSPSLVRVQNAQSLVGALSIRVRVSPSRVLEFQRSNLIINGPGNFGWFGKLVSPDDSEAGLLSLTVLGNEVFGSATANDETYQIQALDGQTHALSLLEKSRIPRPADDTPKSEKDGGLRLNLQQLQSTTTTTSCTYCAVRVLVLYTPAAAASVPNINAVISQAFNEANDAYQNSQISGLTLINAGTVQVSYAEGGPEISRDDRIEADLNDLKTSLSPSLRDQYKADLVVLMTEDVYNDTEGTIYGSVKELRVASDNFHAIVVAKYSLFSQTDTYTFAHEIGHLFGAQHNPEGPVAPQVNYPFEYGHRFSYKPFLKTRRRHRTVMSYNPVYLSDPGWGNTYNQIPYFSNPNVIYDHTATGTSTNDNAQVLSLTKATLAEYRGEPLTALILGPTDVYTGQGPIWSAYSNAPSGTLTYEWASSPNGYSYQTVSTYDTYSRAIKSYDTSFWLRLTIYNGSESATAYSYVTVNGSGCGGCSVSPDDDARVIAAPVAFEVFAPTPNPSQTRTTIRFGLPEASTVDVSVYDLLGRVVMSLPQGDRAPGLHEVAIETSALPPGLYICRIQAGRYSDTQSIAVRR